MFNRKNRIKIKKYHYIGEDDKLRGKDLYDIYLNVGILPPIFNKWVIVSKGLTMFELKIAIQIIFYHYKEMTIKY